MPARTTDISEVNGVGEKRAVLLRKLGINTVFDLLTFYPRGYIDYSNPRHIGEINDGETCVFAGTVTQKLKPYIGPKYSIFRAVIDDGTDALLCTFFNSEYTFQKLFEGKQYIFFGRVTGDLLRRECNSPLFINAEDNVKFVAKYHLVNGVNHAFISKCIQNCLKNFNEPDLLSEKIRSEYQLVDFKTALYSIHFPQSNEELEAARKRLAFEELLVLQLGMSMMKSRNRQLTGASMERMPLDEFYEQLPFVPTGAQLRAVEDCVDDMTKASPMNRLLQGDVGSGKTLVAAACCYFAALNGFQSTLMAPTEILARQHCDTLQGFLEPLGIDVVLLTGSLTAKEKREVKAKIKSGEAQVVVGTQALIQKSVEFDRLGFVVTDEQHRFGVNQRSSLIEKGENPHTLVMSATPIPRTLGLIIYGDLDISLLDEMPKGRQPIKTYGVNSSYRPRLYKFIRKYIENGFQSYIVCPMIEENENEKASAIKYYNDIKEKYFPDIEIGLLYGKMKEKDKDEVMLRFKQNEVKLLVSTTVIEVGVDVPNAVVMVIENAEQFGLSQLHQLRGRVGRGTEQSHCILVTDNENEYTSARIKTMVRTTDGFEIANEDLKLRGPGDFFGAKQHGLPKLKIADMNEDVAIIADTSLLAKRILSEDDKLENTEHYGLKILVEQLFESGVEYGIN